MADSVHYKWKWLPPALAFSTGMIEVLCWVYLNNFYSAAITSDVTQAATYLLPHRHAYLLQLLAVPVFVVGLVCSYFAVKWCGPRRQLVVRLMLLSQATLLLGASALNGAFGPVVPDPGVRILAVGLVAVFTISLSNATMNMLDSEAPTTWALTANSVRAGVAILNVATRTGSVEDRRKDWTTWSLIWPTVLAFAAGSVLAVIAIDHLAARDWLAPCAMSLLYAAVLWRGPPFGRGP